jgi:AraC family transcriptional regulator of adaptative response / DNA-3-methyladenine glycosylase II
MYDPGTAVRARSKEVFERALDARDARFDGVFFVGITSTGIYCRPVCPARVSNTHNRRFFNSAAAAERAGFRPCLRCRPELAPGRAQVDAVPRLADAAARRISAGALNGGTVRELAEDLSVSPRHLRRAMKREIGVSPVELAQTHRLLLAKQLLADTRLSVGRIALASGFQSVRRFNASFRERYRMSPTDVRRSARGGSSRRTPDPAGAATAEAAANGGAAIAGANGMPPTVPAGDLLRLTVAYRTPLDWDALLLLLRRDAIAGVELVEGRRYGRTVRLGECTGVVFAEDASGTNGRSDGGSNGNSGRSNGAGRRDAGHLRLDISVSLLPVLMPLLAGLRQLFDLDAEPEVVDAHLRQGGLGELVDRRPGLRLPGALDGFDVAFRAVLANSARWQAGGSTLVRRVTCALGERFDTGVPGLDQLPPGAECVAAAGERGLIDLGVGRRRATALARVARRVVDGSLRLEPGGDATAARRRLMEIDGVGDRLATTIVMRALQWPDALPFTDPALGRAAGVPERRALRERARAWRPWRAYAALHLWIDADAATPQPETRR